ncbi:alpha-glucuronidase family glycosyl hydrolase [Alicyclobacillus sp. SO9]|uniref:alpha-glucuronidase family glycosyl hydrolase n=1 Tax=Alicyclobacillus sp. SO9 TaxID=2665646 RepID=UPI0018E78719|nr:alpha-glucuronidase family glycosyl hydrolase [Alicyclobacillus sp. SO9]QQE77908.1 alpha-glucuronidase [Alicyclobacillus sp. SO9]
MQYSSNPASTSTETGYEAWLRYTPADLESNAREIQEYCRHIALPKSSLVLQTAVSELSRGIASMFKFEPMIANTRQNGHGLVLGLLQSDGLVSSLIDIPNPESLTPDSYVIQAVKTEHSAAIVLAGASDAGCLYAVFHFLKMLQTGQQFTDISVLETPKNRLRMINHWDNMDGSIERGYAGKSIFYQDNEFTADFDRIQDYARLLASIGINAISLNNVNVHDTETRLITKRYLPDVARVATVFRKYGIRIFLSINFASPIQIGSLTTADPAEPEVQRWWSTKAEEIYGYIPDFGGFLVKADSEFRPGPFTYGRTHTDGANALANALKPFGGTVIWRCFVYDCLQDWRDRTTDRAKAAYEHFRPLDGQFKDNVILQIKNGPMDFQVREPVSPLLGGLMSTNQLLELQITQEYTGQQKHLCYLVPQWKEIISFDTYATGEGSTVDKIASGDLFNRPLGGFAAVSNVGDDSNWTGHLLAQANLFGYGRLSWNPELSSEQITDEWVRLTFGHNPTVVSTVTRMLLSSWFVYENYTAPLGVGWMVNPSHHYGPNVDGYEYSKWGTYHFADCSGIGVDRTSESGTGFTAQYFSPNKENYNSLSSCPDELLLFFHHVPYDHQLKSGKTVIQHIYDSHFQGADEAQALLEQWNSLSQAVDYQRFRQVQRKLQEQAEHAKEWRDIINTYFYRKSGTKDEKGRHIY